MSTQDLFEQILMSLHTAVLDDARWPAVAGLIDEFCGAKGNMLVTCTGMTPEDIEIFFAQFCFRGERHDSLEQEYFRDWHAEDERLPRLRRLPADQIMSVPMLLTEGEMKTSRLYNELMPRTDTQDSLSVRLEGPDGLRIVWTIADPVGGDGWSSDQMEPINRLLPHLRNFVQVRHALARAGTLGSTLVELLESAKIGIVRLDRHARVVAANDVGRALLRGGDELSQQDGALRAALPKENAELQALLARALARPGAGGSMRLSRDGSILPAVLHVVPLLKEDAGGRFGALVLIADPARRQDFDPALVGEILGLTPTESRIAVLLAQGKSIGEVAVEARRSPTTVKWHIRQIYAKCGLSRQADLIQLVAQLAKIPGVRR